ncbi:MAG: hypothetical protein ACR2N4_08395, partial [Jatrophihabitans sp.]
MKTGSRQSEQENDMRKMIGQWGSSVLEVLLPSARAQACTPPYCQQSGSRVRCCQQCSGGVVTCGSWTTGTCAHNNPC